MSDEDKLKADQHKVAGNECMKREEYQNAVDEYSKAIQLDDCNAVYFCNRFDPCLIWLKYRKISRLKIATRLFIFSSAAAFSKLEEHDKALEDCSLALDIDPKYSKAYGRKGWVTGQYIRLYSQYYVILLL